MTDPYDGRVTSGGPSDVRVLDTATIRKCSVGAMDNNAYLITCATTGDQLLIDAADDAPRLRALIREGSGRLNTIVTTHQHWDHVRALTELGADPQVLTAAGSDDAPALPLAPDRLLEHGDTVTVGALGLAVVHLRGHTPGSVALALTEPAGRVHLFTGDSLFPGGVGNTKMPGQSFDSLYRDVTERVFDVYGDDTWVYPGHGGDTTLGAERPSLATWLERGW